MPMNLYESTSPPLLRLEGWRSAWRQLWAPGRESYPRLVMTIASPSRPIYRECHCGQGGRGVRGGRANQKGANLNIRSLIGNLMGERAVNCGQTASVSVCTRRPQRWPKLRLLHRRGRERPATNQLHHSNTMWRLRRWAVQTRIRLNPPALHSRRLSD